MNKKLEASIIKQLGEAQKKCRCRKYSADEIMKLIANIEKFIKDNFNIPSWAFPYLRFTQVYAVPYEFRVYTAYSTILVIRFDKHGQVNSVDITRGHAQALDEHGIWRRFHLDFEKMCVDLFNIDPDNKTHTPLMTFLKKNMGLNRCGNYNLHCLQENLTASYEL